MADNKPAFVDPVQLRREIAESLATSIEASAPAAPLKFTAGWAVAIAVAMQRSALHLAGKSILADDAMRRQVYYAKATALAATRALEARVAALERRAGVKRPASTFKPADEGADHEDR